MKFVPPVADTFEGLGEMVHPSMIIEGASLQLIFVALCG